MRLFDAGSPALRAAEPCGAQPAAAEQHVTFLLTQEFSHLAFASALEPLKLANNVSGRSLYSWSFGSLNGSSATSYSGVTVLTDHDFRSVPKSDFVFLLSGDISADTFPQPLLAALRRLRVQDCTLGAMGTGAFGLAKAGLLKGQKIALHWEMQDSFRELYPDVDLSGDVFSADGPIATAAGGNAAGDCMLHLVRKRHGDALAEAAADRMILGAPREASAPQRTSFQSQTGVRNRHFASALEMMRDHLEEPLPPSEIARRIGISTRQLERIFKSVAGRSPKQFYIELRLQKARRLLIQTEASVTDVALASGFGAMGHFSRVYKNRFGCSPAEQRGWIS